MRTSRGHILIAIIGLLISIFLEGAKETNTLLVTAINILFAIYWQHEGD